MLKVVADRDVWRLNLELPKNALIFVLKIGFGNNKLLFWAKIFNAFNPIQHDLTSPNFITLLSSLKSFSNFSFFAPLREHW